MSEKQPLLSVVIPVYNAEPFLPETLDSLLNQSLRDLEIVCVDDGSPDNSVEVIRRYMEKDSRVRLCRQKNQFAGIARNTGIENARGEWLFFLDADDYVLDYGLEAAVDKARRYQLDFLKFMALTWDEGRNCYVDKKRNNGGFLKIGDYNRLLKLEEGSPLLKVSVTPWSGIYRRAFVMEHHCRYNGLRCVNDRSFYTSLMTHGERMMISQDRVTVHRENQSDSLVGNKAKHFDCCIDSVRITEKQLAEDGIDPEIQELIMQQEYHDLVFWYRKYAANPESKPELDRQMEAYLTGGESDYIFLLEEKLKKMAGVPLSPPAAEVKPFHTACKQPAVTVILPVVGEAETLNRALDGLTRQTLEEAEFLVVDGTGSGEARTVMKEYAAVDGRFTFVDAPGADMGETLNRGLDAAKGTWVAFRRLKDLTEPGLYERLCQEASKYRLDMVQSDYLRYTLSPEGVLESRSVMLTTNAALYGRVLTPLKEREVFFFPADPFGGLYRRGLLEENRIRFEREKREDCLEEAFRLRTLMGSRRARFLRERLYLSPEEGEERFAPDMEGLAELAGVYRAAREAAGKEGGAKRECESQLYDLELKNTLQLWSRMPEETKRQGLELLREEFREAWEKKLFDENALGLRNLERLNQLMTAPEELMTRVDLSVILPVSGGKKIETENLRKLLRAAANMEVICAVDGADPEMERQMREMAKKDGRIRVILSPKRGRGEARNAGVKAARGTYCLFPEPGDSYDVNALDAAWDRAKGGQLDLLVLPSDQSSERRESFGRSSGVWPELLPENRPFAGKDIGPNVFRSVWNRAWDKLVRTELIREKELKFAPLSEEDELPFVMGTLVCAERIDWLEGLPMAHHFAGAGSLPAEDEEPDGFYRALGCLREELKRLDLFEAREQDYVNFALYYALNQLMGLPEKDYPGVYQHLKTEWLAELGVAQKLKAYFYNPEDFSLMGRMRITEPWEFLLRTAREARGRLESIRRMPPADEELKKSAVYRAGMKVTWLPRKAHSAGRLLKEEGLGGTVRYALGKRNET